MARGNTCGVLERLQGKHNAARDRASRGARISGTSGYRACSSMGLFPSAVVAAGRSRLRRTTLIGGFRRPAAAKSFEKRLRFLVRRRALGELFLGLTPEFVVAPFGLSGLLPKFMGANPHLFFRRLCHFVAFSCERDRFRRRTFLRGRAVHRSLSQCEPLQLVPGFGRMAKALPTSRPSAPASISRGRSIRSILRNVRHSPSKSAFA